MGPIRPASKVFSVVDRVRHIEAQREAAMAAAAAPFDAMLENLYAQLDQVGASLDLPAVMQATYAAAGASAPSQEGGEPAEDDVADADDDNDVWGAPSDDQDETDTSKTDIVIAAIRRGGPLDYAILAAKMYPREDQAHARKKLRSLMSSLRQQNRIEFIGNKGDKLWKVVR